MDKMRTGTHAELSKPMFGLLLAGILGLQLLCGLWHIGYPFVDGRYHYNWGPPFWLLHAEEINNVGLLNTYGGLVEYHSHPQLIAPVISVWTSVEGYSETSIRLLAIFLSLLATLFLTLAVRSFVGGKKALAAAVVFAALPLIYIYGKKLDQENLLIVFLALSLWGYGMAGTRKKIALLLVAIGSAGMMLSDWSGAFFALALPVAAFISWGWKERTREIVYFAGASWAAAAAGLLLYLAQSYFQGGAHGIGPFFQTFAHLWAYRAGLASDSVTWLQWLQHAWQYLLTNFTATLFLFAVIGIGWHLAKPASLSSPQRGLAIFATAIFFGSLGYMLAVPQASALHIYYQYYWSIPCAIGIIFFIDAIASVQGHRLKILWGALFVAAVCFAVGNSMYQYHKLLFVDSWGDPSDIDIVKLVRKIPADQSVLAVNPEPEALAWFENPNMKYYAGRDITRVVLGRDVPKGDWMLMPRGVIPDFVSVMDADPRYGLRYVVEAQCATNLCLTRIAKAP